MKGRESKAGEYRLNVHYYQVSLQLQRSLGEWPEMENRCENQTLAGPQYAENPGEEADAQQIGSISRILTRARCEACKFSPRSHSRFGANYALPNTKYERACVATAHCTNGKATCSDRYSHKEK